MDLFASANFLLLTLPADLNFISQHAKSPKQKLQGRKASLQNFVASFCHILLVKSEHRTIQVSRGISGKGVTARRGGSLVQMGDIFGMELTRPNANSDV